MQTFNINFEATLTSSGKLIRRRVKVRANDAYHAMDRAKLKLGEKFLARCIFPAYRFGTQVKAPRISAAVRRIAERAGPDENE